MDTRYRDSLVDIQKMQLVRALVDDPRLPFDSTAEYVQCTLDECPSAATLSKLTENGITFHQPRNDQAFKLRFQRHRTQVRPAWFVYCVIVTSLAILGRGLFQYYFN